MKPSHDAQNHARGSEGYHTRGDVERGLDRGQRGRVQCDILRRLCPSRVKSRDPDRPRARAYVCTTPESYRNSADQASGGTHRSPSLSNSKSEVSGQSGHCSARLLAALRANRRHMQCSKKRAHSITSSASASSVGGMVSPSVFAVFRLITSSNLVDWTTGRLAGFSPLRILPA